MTNGNSHWVKGGLAEAPLGAGGFGDVGLWEYQGDDAAAPAIKKAVVKQTVFDEEAEDPYAEGNIQYAFSKTGSKHIVKTYGPPRLNFFDVKVVHLFLEYCPAGDLHQFLERKEMEEGEGSQIAPDVPLFEADVWAIFNCLALGIAAMDRGTEESDNLHGGRILSFATMSRLLYSHIFECATLTWRSGIKAENSKTFLTTLNR